MKRTTEQNKLYYQKNKKRFQEYNKAYNEKNKDARKEYLKIYRQENKERLNQKKKEYNLKNKEHIKERRKSYDKKTEYASGKNWKLNHKDKIKSYHKKYRENNLEKIKETNRVYNDNNKEKRKLYNLKNKEKRLIYQREYTRQRMKTDILFRLARRFRSNLLMAFKRNGYTKKSRTYEILGCTFQEFKEHLEKQFEPWMNWNNKGLYNGTFNYGWDIDHIVSQSNATSEDEFIKLNHYTNLQPLCSKVNRDIKKNY